MKAAHLAPLLLGFIAVPAHGVTIDAGEERVIAACIHQAAGGRVWLERTLWGLRDQEGGWIGAEVANTDGSHDLGPLQINSQWVAKIAVRTRREDSDVRRWLTHDPCFNVNAARWIFLSALKASGDYWRAIGIYHSPRPPRGQRYALAIGGRLRRRFGPEVFQAEPARQTSGDQIKIIPSKHERSD